MHSLQAIKQRFGIISISPKLDRALDTAIRVAGTDLTVLIHGESGVGKEVFSKIIHALSPRKHNQFIAINCGAIPAGTINSELFGHEKGSFTGATGERKGYFETVDGGTIFLDEVGEMPLDTQAFLLRVLESGEFIRVGSSVVRKTDVRVIAATNVDLLDRVRKGKFREDLYYRLNTVPIRVPALRERPEDIFLLFRKFSNDLAEQYNIEPVQLDQEARKMMESYSWPGNVRELKNVAEQLTILAERRLVGPEDLLSLIPEMGKRQLPMIPGKDDDISERFHEREILYKFLFDMKNDLNHLKTLIFELVRQNNLEMPTGAGLKPMYTPAFLGEMQDTANRDAALPEDSVPEYHDQPSNQPIILGRADDTYQKAEVVEENLSLVEMEKDLIMKALKKHNGKRRDAAQELGISERTLYRKIKEYDLPV